MRSVTSSVFSPSFSTTAKRSASVLDTGMRLRTSRTASPLICSSAVASRAAASGAGGGFSSPAAAFLRPALDGGGAVLIHCEQGINRSAAIAIAFLLEWRMEPLLDVVASAFAARPIILQNQGFVTQLVEHAAALGLLEVDAAVAARRAERMRDPAAHRAAVIAQLGKV